MICRKLYCAVETAPWFASGYVLWVIFRFFYFLLVSVRARVAMAATRLHRCRRLSGRFLSFLLFARLLCFSALVCHRCLAEPLLLLLSIFTFHVLFFISPSKHRCSPASIGLPVPSSSSLVSLLPPAGPNRSKLQDMLANLRDAEDLPSMQPAVTPPSRSSVPRLNEHEVGRPDDGSPPSVSAQRSCVSDVNVQTFPVSVLQRR